jgi:hypothetical protein
VIKCKPAPAAATSKTLPEIAAPAVRDEKIPVGLLYNCAGDRNVSGDINFISNKPNVRGIATPKESNSKSKLVGWVNSCTVKLLEKALQLFISVISTP